MEICIRNRKSRRPYHVYPISMMEKILDVSPMELHHLSIHNRLLTCQSWNTIGDWQAVNIIFECLTSTRFSCLALGHVLEHILHCLAVRQLTWRLSTGCTVHLLATLALVSVQQEDQLLLDHLWLFGVGVWWQRWRSATVWRMLKTASGGSRTGSGCLLIRDGTSKINLLHYITFCT